MKRSFRLKGWLVLIIIVAAGLAGASFVLLTHAGAKPTFTANDFKCAVAASGVPAQTIQEGSIGGCVDYYKSLLGEYQQGTGLAMDNQLNTAQSEIGDFDAKTTQVTKSFQKIKGILPNGVVDGFTWQALTKACYVDIQCEPQVGVGLH